MNHSAFQLNKVRRAIRTMGVSLTFETPQLNEFGEPSGGSSRTEVSGIFHESVFYVSKNTSEASTTSKKTPPMFLCLWEDCEGITPRLSETRINGKLYKVNGVTNLDQSNLIADISLEEVQSNGI